MSLLRVLLSMFYNQPRGPAPPPPSPTLRANLKPITRRVRAQSGTGTAGRPYILVVPIAPRSEWTVQAVTGSNVNGASDADDWATPVPTGGCLHELGRSLIACVTSCILKNLVCRLQAEQWNWLDAVFQAVQLCEPGLLCR